MKKIALFLLIAIVAIGVGLYYQLRNKGVELDFTAADIESRLAHKLPIQKNYLMIFDVELDNPQVAFNNESERVWIGLDLNLAVRIGQASEPLEGQVVFSTAISYEPLKAALFLSEPRTELIEIPGVPQNYLDNAGSIVTSAMEAYFAETPLYEFSVEDTTVGLVIKQMRIADDHLKVRLGLD